jgi:opacity protein-like surface antigen
VAIINSIKRSLIIVFTAATSLSAQEIAPEDSTSGEVESEVENPPTPSIEPILQTNPDDGSVRAGFGALGPTFFLGRRIRLSTSVTGGYNDNVNQLPTGSPSWYANPNAVFTYEFGNARLAMNLVAGAGITYYFAHPQGRDYDPDIHLSLSLAYKATERLTLNLTAFAAYQSQPDLTTGFTANRQLGNFFRSTDGISAHYKWTPRFSTVTSATLNVIEYESSSASSLNRTESSFGEEGRYLLFPTTTLTGEYRFGVTAYQQNTSRDSTTNSLSAGFDQTFSPHLEGSLRAGAQFRSSDKGGGGQSSPYLETLLHYTFERSGAPTYVIWSNRYGLEESDLPNGTSRETFRTNLQAVYGITPRISATLGLTYSHGDSVQSSVSNSLGGQSSTETIFDISPGVRYLITRQLSINAGYRYTKSDRGSGREIITNLQSIRSYTRNVYFAGLTYTF